VRQPTIPSVQSSSGFTFGNTPVGDVIVHSCSVYRRRPGRPTCGYRSARSCNHGKCAGRAIPLCFKIGIAVFQRDGAVGERDVPSTVARDCVGAMADQRGRCLVVPRSISRIKPPRGSETQVAVQAEGTKSGAIPKCIPAAGRLRMAAPLPNDESARIARRIDGSFVSMSVPLSLWILQFETQTHARSQKSYP